MGKEMEREDRGRIEGKMSPIGEIWMRHWRGGKGRRVRRGAWVGASVHSVLFHFKH